MTNHTKIKIDAKSWDAGYRAGLEDLPDRHGKDIDGYSWSSGYVEGQTEKKKNKSNPEKQSKNDFYKSKNPL